MSPLCGSKTGRTSPKEEAGPADEKHVNIHTHTHILNIHFAKIAVINCCVSFYATFAQLEIIVYFFH
jgi:hypothetical protein